MLRVTVELIPFGCEEAKRVLGTCDIANITDLDDAKKRKSRDYAIDFADMGTFSRKQFTVKRHKREDGFWELIRRAIVAAKKKT